MLVDLRRHTAALSDLSLGTTTATTATVYGLDILDADRGGTITLRRTLNLSLCVFPFTTILCNLVPFGQEILADEEVNKKRGGGLLFKRQGVNQLPLLLS